MSEAKCPLCGGDLIQSEEFPCFYSCQSTNWKSDADKLCELDDCAASVPVWEALRRTRKALEIAKRSLEDCEKILKADRKDWEYLTAEIALKQIEQITTPERKEHFADTSKKIEQKDHFADVSKIVDKRM